MPGVQQIAIAADDDDLRFDRWVHKHFPALGHGQLQKMLRTGQFRIDGARIKASTRVQRGQMVRVPPMPDAPETPPAKNPAPLSDADQKLIKSLVVFENDAIIALNKPSGLAVQGGSKTHRHIDGMLDALKGRGERPKLVHRLDRDTSGLLVLAKSAAVARKLSFAFQQHQIQKLYWAITLKKPERREGVIDLALAKQGGPGKERMSGDADSGKFARTAYQVLASGGSAASWLALLPLTGRTHQLRAHCAAIKSPILGDGKYGGKAALETNAPKGLMLHAREMMLDVAGLPKVALTAEPPQHFADALTWLGLETAKVPYAALSDWSGELTRFR